MYPNTEKTLQSSIPKPAPVVKWRDMNTTILGKRKRNPSDSQDVAQSATRGDPNIQPMSLETDGLGDLDQPPPNLTGVDGTRFTIASQVDIQSPVLLDILSDKPEVPKKMNAVDPPSSLSRAVVKPKESEWNEW
jgi:hypothetical protein